VAAGVSGTASPPTAAGMSAAGVSGAAPSPSAGTGGAAAAHACLIPDNLAIVPDDADGGVLDPACQNVPRKIIAESCIGGICHDSSGPPAGNLDLMAPCVAERLINVTSSCQNKLLIDTNNERASFLIDKLASEFPTCGESMPFTGHLPPNEVACMEAWIHAVIRAAR
jgi:hypothetical protein